MKYGLRARDIWVIEKPHIFFCFEFGIGMCVFVMKFVWGGGILWCETKPWSFNCNLTHQHNTKWWYHLSGTSVTARVITYAYWVYFFVCMPCYGISPVTAVNPLFGKQWWRNKLGELFLFDSLDSKWLLSDINLCFIVYVYSNKHHLNMPFMIVLPYN